jgi:hypothetical protein
MYKLCRQTGREKEKEQERRQMGYGILKIGNTRFLI